jgi:electron transfer flavoprotein alpha subunit
MAGDLMAPPMRRVLACLEQTPSGLERSSLELVAAAAMLGAEVEAVIVGPVSDECCRLLGEHGVGVVHDCGEAGDRSAALRIASGVVELVRAGDVDAIVFGASYDGRDGAARVSARLDRPVVANVVGFEITDGKVFALHELFGATVRARSQTDGRPQCYLIRPKAFSATPTSGAPATRHLLEVTVAPAIDGVTVLERSSHVSQGPDLDLANVVVTGGRGLGDAASYALVERLAELLGGAPGATRAIVDAGWVPYAQQVGQTGRTVKPEVYIACGVSGATQHLVGMKGARHVIAINRDESAPMLKIADLAVVGDVHAILPKLIESLERS